MLFPASFGQRDDVEDEEEDDDDEEDVTPLPFVEEGPSSPPLFSLELSAEVVPLA